MSVVAGQTRRRWALVAGAVAVLCALPTIDSALPASVPRVPAAQLRERILASAGRPYTGYAESNASFGLPGLDGLSGVTSLVDGVTRMRVWQGSADSWRVDVLTDVGENDTYQTPRGTYLWSSDSELLTHVVGKYPIRLPRPADFVPPALALRLLREAGPGARVSGLPPRRVAGISAAGLRVIPGDQASTIAQADIWAEPGSWLPVDVEIFGRGSSQPAIETQFLQVSSWHPNRATLTPRRGPGTAFTQADAADLSGALSDIGAVLLPASLAGRPRVAAPLGFGQVGIYGRGLATFVVLEIGGSAGLSLISGARVDGGSPLRGPDWFGVVITTRLITAVMLHPYSSSGTFVLAGFVDRRLLRQAADDLAAEPW